MAEVKAGDLNLQSFGTEEQWNRNYEILVSSESASEIMNILLNSTQKEKEFYAGKAFSILFCSTNVTTGAGEIIGALASTGIGAIAGGATAATLGATTVATTTGGIFGFFAATTTAVAAAPVTLVAGATAGAAVLGYGAYKLISKSAKAKGKEEHYKETKQQGRYAVNNVRAFNPFLLVNQEFEYIKRSYDYLIALPSLDRQTENEFLSFFDSHSALNNFRVNHIRDSGGINDKKGLVTYKDELDNIAKELQPKLRDYYEKIRQRHKIEVPIKKKYNKKRNSKQKYKGKVSIFRSFKLWLTTSFFLLCIVVYLGVTHRITI